MRFDGAKAVGDLGTFAFPREAGLEGERRAAALVAERLAGVGWKVERFEALGSRRLQLLNGPLPWLVMAAVLTVVALVDARAPSAVVRWLTVGAGFTSLVVLAVLRFGERWGWLRDTAVPVVVANRPDGPDATTRVVFQTALDVEPRGLLAGSRVFLGRFQMLNSAIVAGVLASLAWRATSYAIYASAFLMLTSLGVVPILLFPRALLPPPWSLGLDTDNCGGLATLLELARAWPGTAAGRIETWFVAAGGGALNRAGLRMLLRSRRADWDTKPTLFISLQSIAAGQKLTIISPPGERLAGFAAADLWTPHRVITDRLSRSDYWPIETRGSGFVVLLGTPDAAGDVFQLDDPERLRRAAQLASEIALRWSKSCRATAQVPGATEARSSQNPG
jgi:hypothetical protein